MQGLKITNGSFQPTKYSVKCDMAAGRDSGWLGRINPNLVWRLVQGGREEAASGWLDGLSISVILTNSKLYLFIVVVYIICIFIVYFLNN